MLIKSSILLIVLRLLPLCRADEILGCGGFLKSDVFLDYSRVQIKLLTKKGAVKDQTECAPNNGYYFLPLYDKGEYVLKVEPPTGWSFDKTEISLTIDGETDPCSTGKDINFYFKGFGITGQVTSLGSRSGPVGVSISYVDDKKKTRETVTGNDGHFHFTPVVPGEYVIKASHPKWKLQHSSVVVKVSNTNAEVPKESLVVAGYDVTGTISTNSLPIRGVYFVIFSTRSALVKTVLSGCNTDRLPGFSSDLGQPLCHVQSSDDGKFTYPVLPTGTYTLIPFYKENNIQFEIEPKRLEFSVEHESLIISTSFEVTGLTVSGRVLSSKNGPPIKGAEVLLNDKVASLSTADGSYTLHSIFPGNYKLNAKAENVQFTEVSIEITPKKYFIPDLYPNAYRICGQVIGSKVYSVAFRDKSTGNLIKTTQSDPKNRGKFCDFLPSGQYDVQVLLDSDETSEQFFPISYTVEIVQESPPEIIFSQLKATVSGTVQCFVKSECDDFKVHLKPMSTSSSTTFYATVADGKYEFVEIPPGRYEVSVTETGLCWETSKFYIAINSAEAVVTPFKQTGYQITLRTSHDTKVKYELVNDEKSDGETSGFFDNPEGTSSHCLRKAGRYRFTGISCHGYEPKSIEWSTSARANSGTPVILNAVTHAHGFKIVIGDETNDHINCEIYNQNNELMHVLNPVQVNIVAKQTVYEFELQVAHNEIFTIVPKSSKTLFNPEKSQFIGSFDCVKEVIVIQGSKGKIIDGKIIPPLAGVLITIEANDEKVATFETKADGLFQFGPLDDSIPYTITASKENYLISKIDSEGNFKAHRMADITVGAIDNDTHSPISGVLVSLSGGENYRRNKQTNADGKIQFTSLSPGEYYMRPMMKEYRFEPASKMISIKEGHSVKVSISAKRIAFSAFGMVRSLSGVGEFNVVVEARGFPSETEPACDGHLEEVTTDTSGAFRLRGLLPSCSYNLQIKHTFVPQTVGDHHPGYVLKNIQSDVHGVDLISLQQPTYMDITAHVYATNPDHYRVLRVKIGHGDELNNPVQAVRLDPQLISQRKSPIPKPGVLVTFNSIPYDFNEYFIQLESSLPQTIHQYDTEPIYFHANKSFTHFSFNFDPKIKASENDINQSSILILPLFLLIGFLAYNLEAVLETVRGVSTKTYTQLTTSAQSTTKPYGNRSDFVPADDTEIDQIVLDINATKPKSKKKVLLIR